MYIGDTTGSYRYMFISPIPFYVVLIKLSILSVFFPQQHFRAIAEKHHDVTANQIELLKYQISMSPRYKTVVSETNSITRYIYIPDLKFSQIKVGGHCMKIHLNGSGDRVHM